MRISDSFSEGEIQALDFLVRSVLQGGSVAVVARHPHFASLARKVQSMKARVLQRELAEELKEAERKQGLDEVLRAIGL